MLVPRWVSAPFCVFLVVYRIWASLRLGHLRERVLGWLPRSIFSLGDGFFFG